MNSPSGWFEELFSTGEVFGFSMERRIRVRGHPRSVGNRRVWVDSYYRRIPHTRPSERGLYLRFLPRNRRTDIIRVGYENEIGDVGSSLTLTGPVVGGSVNVSKKKRLGVEHNPISGITKPYVESKDSGKE